MSESGLVACLQSLCEAKGEMGKIGWRGVGGLVQGAGRWGQESQLHCQVRISCNLHSAQVADLLVRRMTSSQRKGDEGRMGEILLLLER